MYFFKCYFPYFQGENVKNNPRNSSAIQEIGKGISDSQNDVVKHGDPWVSNITFKLKVIANNRHLNTTANVNKSKKNPTIWTATV